jgi:hypothetical protein
MICSTMVCSTRPRSVQSCANTKGTKDTPLESGVDKGVDENSRNGKRFVLRVKPPLPLVPPPLLGCFREYPQCPRNTCFFVHLSQIRISSAGPCEALRAVAFPVCPQISSRFRVLPQHQFEGFFVRQFTHPPPGCRANPCKSGIRRGDRSIAASYPLSEQSGCGKG